MFGTTKYITPEEPRIFGAQSDRTATNESARVLPWFAGRRWLGVTWMGDAFFINTTTNRGYPTKYYASFVGLICNGPVDRLYKIKFDGDVVWQGDVARGEADYIQLTIPSRGLVRFYWGSETQVVDAHAEQWAPGVHSGYRGQAYIVGQTIFFGYDKTTAPNIEVEVARWNYPSWISEADAIIEGDSNPIAVLWEWWTEKRFGLNFSESDLDVDRLSDAAETLASEGLSLSPMLNSPTSIKDAILQLLEHIDGYPTTYNGKFGIELVRERAPVKTLSNSDMVSDLRLSSQSWSDTFDEVRVKFKDREIDGQDNTAKHHDLANFQITGKHRAAPVLERPWVVRQAVAIKIAGAEGRVAGQPQAKGSVALRESAAVGIDVGSVFDFTTRDSQTIRLRCTGRTEPAPGKRDVEIEFESDRGWANREYFAPPADEIPDTPLTEPLPPYDVRVHDAPYALASDGTLASLLFMVARADTYSTAFDVWKSTAADGSYESASSRRGSNFLGFAIRAKLTSEYTSATYPVDQLVGISFQVLGEDEAMLAEEYDLAAGLSHELLAIFGSTANEIVSMFDIVRTGTKTYTAKCIRGLYDTRRRTHPVDTEMWVQLRVGFEPDAWPPLSESARFYKAQPFFSAASVELSDIAAESHTENARTLLPICPPNVRANNDAVHPTWVTGNPVTVQWSNTSRARTVFGLGFGDAPATDLEAVEIEVRSLDGTTLHDTLSVSPTGEETTLANAYLVSAVNASFRLRVYGVRSGRRSIDYGEVSVVKV